MGQNLLPLLTSRPKKKSKSKKKVRSHSVLDNILTNQRNFMKTYFQDLKSFYNDSKYQRLQ